MSREDLDYTRPARKARVITPDDDVILNPPTRGLYIGTTGAITVLHTEDTEPITYPNAVGGFIYPWSVQKVLATGTDANDIIGQF